MPEGMLGAAAQAQPTLLALGAGGAGLGLINLVGLF